MTNVEKAAEFVAQQEVARKATFVPGMDVKDLGIVKNNLNVIEARGQIPIVDTETPITYTEIMRREKFDRFYRILVNSRDEIIDKYTYPNGPVISKGYAHGSYVSISILVGSEVDDETLDSIYDIIEQEANEVGIENVPVVFEYGELPVLDEEIMLDGSIPDTEDTDLEGSTGEPANENESEITNSTPGFSALTLLIIIFMLWRFKSN